VDAALREYARYAARAVGDQIVAGSRTLRWQLLAPALGAAEGEVGLAAYMAAVRARLARLGQPADSVRGGFRLDVRSGRFEGWGRLADEALVRDARATFELRLRDVDPALEARIRDEPRAVTVPSPEGPLYVVFGDRYTPDGRRAATYGVALPRPFVVRYLVHNLAGPTLLPPSLVAPGWRLTGGLTGADTLVAFRIEESPWGEVYRSPRQFSSAAAGEYQFEGLASTLRIAATLHPALAARLRAGYLRRPAADGQLLRALLAAGLVAAAALHLRRERQLARARRDFVASVSHELRTPLAQIRLFSETLLLRREHDEAERMRWLGVIGREARRLGDLVENILLFSHLDAARLRLEPERTDLGELAEEVVESYVPVAAQRRMRLTADAPSRIYARVDPRALRQIVVNLLDNALKYGPPGQAVRLGVERCTTPLGPCARLWVSDEGPGVARVDRERIWRPFVRLPATGGAAAGSGIGLSVVRSLAEQHGGTASVEDAEGGGARFVVLLPLDTEPSAPAEAPAAAAATSGVPARASAYARTTPTSAPRSSAGPA
jgi:signal transduction histidine kinase